MNSHYNLVNFDTYNNTTWPCNPNPKSESAHSNCMTLVQILASALKHQCTERKSKYRGAEWDTLVTVFCSLVHPGWEEILHCTMPRPPQTTERERHEIFSWSRRHLTQHKLMRSSCRYIKAYKNVPLNAFFQILRNSIAFLKDCLPIHYLQYFEICFTFTTIIWKITSGDLLAKELQTRVASNYVWLSTWLLCELEYIIFKY